MSRLTGPSSTNPSQALRLRSTIERLRQKSAEPADGAPPVARDSFSSTGPSTSARLGLGATTQPITDLAGGIAARGALSTRLTALTGKSSERVLTGDVVIERAADLARLAGVTRLDGSLSLMECALDALSLAHARALVEISGGLAIEGASGVAAIDAFSSLQKVGGALYLGSLRTLEAIALPALAHVGRALIVENNPRLAALELPRLVDVAGYLHVHENERLTTLSLPLLERVGAELSLLDCPRLARIDAPLLKAVDDVELTGLGGATLALAL